VRATADGRIDRIVADLPEDRENVTNGPISDGNFYVAPQQEASHIPPAEQRLGLGRRHYTRTVINWGLPC
jgi:hypothetical protein